MRPRRNRQCGSTCRRGPSRRLGNAPEGLVVGSSGWAAAVRNPDAVVLFDATTGAVRQTVKTSGAARHLPWPDRTVRCGPLERSNELLQLNSQTASVTSIANRVGRGPQMQLRPRRHDRDHQRTGRRSGVRPRRRGGQCSSRTPPQPGGVAAVGEYAAVADVQGNGVWVYDASTRQLVAQRPVGVKLTHAVALSDDLVAFADTDGGAVLIERIDPEITPVARIDAPDKPYGMAYDSQRHRLYVTLTASNVLRDIDVSDPTKPRTLGGVPTVQQPNSAAVDPRSGAVLVTGSDPGGASSLQIITPDLLPPE